MKIAIVDDEQSCIEQMKILCQVPKDIFANV